jgi:hypothetical protein
VPDCEREDLVASIDEQPIDADDQPADAPLNESNERFVVLLRGCSSEIGTGTRR